MFFLFALALYLRNRQKRNNPYWCVFPTTLISTELDMQLSEFVMKQRTSNFLAVNELTVMKT